MNPDPVMTLDLRTQEGLAYAQNLQGRSATELGPSSRVLVVDTTDSLSEHHVYFERLARLPQVTSVVLVAVGGIGSTQNGRILRTPSALAGVGVTLWVGDGPGVPWQGGAQRPGAGRGEANLTDLLTALRFPTVFDRVFQETTSMPHQAANPGLAVDYAAIEPALMRALKLRVLRQLVATGVAARQHDRESAELAAVVRGTTEGDAAALRPGSPLHQAIQTAHSRVRAAVRSLEALRGLSGLLGVRGAHRSVLGKLAEAAAAVRGHHSAVRRALEDVDSSLAEGYPPPTGLVEQGLPSPAPINPAELADALRKAVSTELGGGRTIPGLADQARDLGNQLGAARSLVITGETVEPDVETWLGRLSSPPPFPLWPVPVAHLLPVVFATTLLAGWVPGWRWWPAAGVAVVWLGLVALMLARSPARPDARTPLTATGTTAVLGGVAGAFFPALPSFGPVFGAAVLVVLLLIAFTAAVLGWRQAVGAWSAAVPIRRADAANRRMEEQIRYACATRWVPADRNRRLADALLVVAGGLDAVAEVFGDVIRQQRDHDGPAVAGDSSTGLAEVLHHDLVAVTMEVLRPAFDEISSRLPLSGDSYRYVLRAQELVSDYNDHLDHAGLRELPSFVTDDGPRRRLASTLWRSSEASRRILLLTERSQMTQLCAAEDVRLLQADGAVVVHFASSDMDLPPIDTGEVIRTRGDAVGAIRLTPILARYVEREVHVVSQPEGDQR